MRSLKLKVRYPKRSKTTTDSHHNEAISPNRLNRQFKVDLPNRVAFYNGQRSHSTLSYRSLIEFERAFYRKVA